MFRRFSPAEEASINALESFWDSWNEGDQPEADTLGLDSALAATIERLYSPDDAPTARPEFSAALLEKLMSVAEPMLDDGSTTDIGPAVAPSVPPDSVPRPEESRRSRPRQSRLWAMASAGTVLLLLLLVVAGFSIWHSEPESEQRFAPLRTDVTEDGVVISTLLEARVAGGILTSDPTKWIASFKFSLEPGEHWRNRPISCQLSRQYVVGLVESGTLAMINSGPFEIRRADGSIESIPAGTRADVRAGDSWVYFADRTETNVEKWNPGSVPMVAYQTDWALDVSCETTPGNPEWVWKASTSGKEFDTTRPVVLTIEQAFVEPSKGLSTEDLLRIGLLPEDDEIFVVNGVESGTLEAAVLPGELETRNSVSQEPEIVHVLEPGENWSSLNNLPLPEGKERQFRSGSGDALLLTTIAWRYADSVADREQAPELLQTDAVADDIVIQTLLEEQVQGGTMLGERTKWITASKFSLEPGEEWQGASVCEQSQQYSIGLVESGTLTMDSSEPFEVVRSDGSTESIPAEQTSELQAGESWVYVSDFTERSVQMSNSGSEPMVAYLSDWAPGSSCETMPANPGWVWQDAIFKEGFNAARHVVVTMEHVSIEPGSEISSEDAARLGLVPREEDIFIVAGVESGSLETLIVPQQSFLESPVAQEPVSVSTLGPGESRSSATNVTLFAGNERQFRSGGDEALVFTTIAWRYSDSAAVAPPRFVRTPLLEEQFATTTDAGEGAGSMLLNRAILGSGSLFSPPVSCGAPSVQAVVIERGEISIDLQSPMIVTRQDGTVAHVEAPATVNLGAGDSFVRNNSAGISDAAIQNDSQYPLVVFQALIFPRIDCEPSQQQGTVEDVRIDWSQAEELHAAGSISEYRISIQRITINHGSYFPEMELIGSRRAGEQTRSRILLSVHSGTLTESQIIGDVQQPADIYHAGDVIDLTELQDAAISADFIRAAGDSVEATIIILEPIDPDSS